MKAIISISKTLAALSKVGNVISKSTVVPIIENVMLSFERDNLYIRGTDLETTLISKIECSCKEPFEVLVDHGSFQSILKALPEQPVTIKLEKNSVSIISDNGTSKLPICVELDHFPKIPDEEFLFSLDVNEDFFSALYSANTCRVLDDSIVNMNTACLDFKGKTLSIVGLDRFMMFKQDIAVSIERKMQSLVRDKFVQTVKGFAVGTLSVGEKFVKLEHNGETSITRVQDNKYCLYDTIIPNKIDYNVKVARTDFITHIKQALATADKTVKQCVLSIKDGVGKISSADLAYSKEGSYSFKVICDNGIEPISFNGGQMLHIMSLLSSDEVDFSIRGPQSSIYIKPSDDDSVFCMVQPLMI